VAVHADAVFGVLSEEWEVWPWSNIHFCGTDWYGNCDYFL